MSQYRWFLANKKADSEADLEIWRQAAFDFLSADPSLEGYEIVVTTGKEDFEARWEKECMKSWQRWSESVIRDDLLDGPRYHGLLVPVLASAPPYVGKPTHEMINMALLRDPEPLYVYALLLNEAGAVTGMREVTGCYEVTPPNGGKRSFAAYGRLDISPG